MEPTGHGRWARRSPADQGRTRTDQWAAGWRSTRAAGSSPAAALSGSAWSAGARTTSSPIRAASTDSPGPSRRALRPARAVRAALPAARTAPSDRSATARTHRETRRSSGARERATPIAATRASPTRRRLRVRGGSPGGPQILRAVRLAYRTAAGGAADNRRATRDLRRPRAGGIASSQGRALTDAGGYLCIDRSPSLKQPVCTWFRAKVCGCAHPGWPGVNGRWQKSSAVRIRGVRRLIRQHASLVRGATRWRV